MTTESEVTTYPELERLTELGKSGRTMVIQDFLDWITGKGWEIAEYDSDEYSEHLNPIMRSHEAIMYEFFDIDPVKIVATLLTLENDIEKECDKTTMIYSTNTWPYSISTVANHPDCKEGK